MSKMIKIKKINPFLDEWWLYNAYMMKYLQPEIKLSLFDPETPYIAQCCIKLINDTGKLKKNANTIPDSGSHIYMLFLDIVEPIFLTQSAKHWYKVLHLAISLPTDWPTIN